MKNPQANPWLTKREVVKFLRFRGFFDAHHPSPADFEIAGEVLGCNMETARVCWAARFKNDGPPRSKNNDPSMITTGISDPGLVALVDAAEWLVHLTAPLPTAEVTAALKRASERGLAVRFFRNVLRDTFSADDVAVFIDFALHDVEVCIVGDSSDTFALIDSRVVVLGLEGSHKCH